MSSKILKIVSGGALLNSKYILNIKIHKNLHWAVGLFSTLWLINKSHADGVFVSAI